MPLRRAASNSRAAGILNSDMFTEEEKVKRISVSKYDFQTVFRKR
jgi:hypothetical protein